MRALRLSLGLVAFAGWFAFAFAPRADVTAGPAVLDGYPGEVPTLHGSVVHESDGLAMPTQVTVAGDKLVVVDRFAERPVHVLSARSGEVVKSLGREGEGPGEFKVARFVDPDPVSEGAFWVYDAGLSRLTRVDLADWDQEPSWEHRIVQLEASTTVLNPVWLDEERLLAAGLFLDGRLGRFDASGKAHGVVGPLPVTREGVPSNVVQHAFRGILKPRPDRALLALGTRHAATVEIFTAEGELVARASGPFSFQPVFQVAARAGGPSMASGGDLRFGYVDIATTSDRIYALFSGRTRDGFPGRAVYAEYVHVFDWSGRYERAFRLDTEVAAIAVDDEAGRLFAIRHLPEPAVLEYPL
jgi:hypothetical protein